VFPFSYSEFYARYAAPRQMRLRKKCRKSHDALASAVAALYGDDSPLLDEMGECPDYTDILPGIQHAAEFQERISPLTWTCRLEDVRKDLPPLMKEVREVELGPEGRRVYDDLERELYAAIGSGVSINSYLTLLTRLKQATSGYLPDSNGTICRIDTAKRDCLYDLLREAAGEPAIVFARYHADLDTIQSVAKQLGLRYAEISGRRKDGLTADATLTDRADVTGVQPQSGGVGVDLSRATLGLGYSFARSPNLYDQAVARMHGPGVNGRAWYDIVCRDTVDADDHSGTKDLKQVIAGVLRRLSVK
jgi:hypothetical protein